MNNEEFVMNAIRTESRIEAVRLHPEWFCSALGAAIVAGSIIDDMKKKVFYGKAVDRHRQKHMVEILGSLVETLREIDQATDAEFDANCVDTDINPRVFHGLIGIHTESAELLSALADSLVEGNEFDMVNIGEELGDIDWYKAILLDATGMKESVIREKVIAKLRKRYPNKFDSDAAINRDVVAERAILEK